MTLQIIKHTGQFETVDTGQVDELGKAITAEREITEVVQTAEFTDEEKPMMAKKAQLRAMLLSRDTGKKHVVKMV
jgi:hypothetical protein